MPLLFLIHVVYIYIYLPQESLRQGGTPRAHQPPFSLHCTTSLEKPVLLNVLRAQPFREGPAQAEAEQSQFTLRFSLCPSGFGLITKELRFFFAIFLVSFQDAAYHPPAFAIAFVTLRYEEIKALLALVLEQGRGGEGAARAGRARSFCRDLGNTRRGKQKQALTSAQSVIRRWDQ